MKKQHLYFLVIFTNIIAYCQPQLNELNFPATYSADVYDGNVTGLSPGNSGQNQIWDFSSVSLTYKSSITKIPIESAPFANNFPTANYCWKYVFPMSTLYQLYKLNNDSFELMASVNDVIIYSDYTPDPATVFSFPYVYNTVINSTYQSVGNSVTPFSNHYDAYGTLITPYGTFSNVARQKDLNYYTWFNVDPFYIIASGNFPGNYISFYQNTALGTNNLIADRKILLYPNPTNSFLNLKLPENKSIDYITITDVTGKTIKEESQNTNLLNVANLANGVYTLQAFSGKDKFESKFVKL